MKTIQKEILSAITSSHRIIGRNTLPQEFTATFEVPWDSWLFVAQQKYSEPAHVAFKSAMTLTGSLSNAQAMTTEEYMQQVWPVTGVYMTQLVAESIQAFNHCSNGNFKPLLSGWITY